MLVHNDCPTCIRALACVTRSMRDGCAMHVLCMCYACDARCMPHPCATSILPPSHSNISNQHVSACMHTYIYTYMYMDLYASMGERERKRTRDVLVHLDTRPRKAAKCWVVRVRYLTSHPPPTHTRICTHVRKAPHAHTRTYTHVSGPRGRKEGKGHEAAGGRMGQSGARTWRCNKSGAGSWRCNKTCSTSCNKTSSTRSYGAICMVLPPRAQAEWQDTAKRRLQS